jgi:hypothetical protein
MSARGDKPVTVCMYAPSANCGHARYTWELLSALARCDGDDDRRRYELLTSRDLAEEFRSDLYAIHPILEPLRRRETYGNRLAWAASRRG